MCSAPLRLFFFFFNDTATTEIYTLSLHDALPISSVTQAKVAAEVATATSADTKRFVRAEAQRLLGSLHVAEQDIALDRKSTRLNSSHGYISYAVFCLKKKNNKYVVTYPRLLPASP